MDAKKKLISQGKRDVTKAGRMFFDAVFGDTEDFLRSLDAEGDAACGDESDALTVEGHDVTNAPSSSPMSSSQPRQPHPRSRR